MKFYENRTSGIRAVLCGQTDGRMDMMNLIVALLQLLGENT